MIMLNDATVRKIIAELGTAHPISKDLEDSLAEVSSDRADALRRAAKVMYDDGSNDNVEIDDGAPLSEGDQGSWVNAWVWVPWSEIPAELQPSGCSES